jgi:hypothetical protein
LPVAAYIFWLLQRLIHIIICAACDFVALVVAGNFLADLVFFVAFLSFAVAVIAV